MSSIYGSPYTRLSATMITPGATIGATAPFDALGATIGSKRLTPAQASALINASNRCCFPIGGCTRAALAFMLSRSTAASAENDTIKCALWTLTPCAGVTGDVDPVAGVARSGYIADYLGLLTAITAGAGVGTATAADLVATEYMADALTWTPATTATTPDGILDSLQSADEEGTNTAYSPGANCVARLLLRSLGRAQFLVFDFHTGSDAATLGNCLIQSQNI